MCLSFIVCIYAFALFKVKIKQRCDVLVTLFVYALQFINAYTIYLLLCIFIYQTSIGGCSYIFPSVYGNKSRTAAQEYLSTHIPCPVVTDTIPREGSRGIRSAPTSFPSGNNEGCVTWVHDTELFCSVSLLFNRHFKFLCFPFL